jgi:hypothetical protein
MSNRRDFITLLCGAAAGPLDEVSSDPANAFHEGLNETGYVRAPSVAIEYRWAANEVNRIPALATELVRRPVSGIAAATSCVIGIACRFW